MGYQKILKDGYNIINDSRLISQDDTPIKGFVLHTFKEGLLDVDDIIKRDRRIRRNSPVPKDTFEHVTEIIKTMEEELGDYKVDIT